ncbi:hypothetical protein PT2222_180125 [Paraburkholderia tropica]
MPYFFLDLSFQYFRIWDTKQSYVFIPLIYFHSDFRRRDHLLQDKPSYIKYVIFYHI